MKVLLVDDDPHIQIATGEHLRVLSKIDVVPVYNGQEALDRLATDEHFDCIVLDSRMPVMTGKEFLDAYKGNIPIILSSAYDNDIQDSKIAAYVPKHMSAFELAEEIRRVCESVEASGDKDEATDPAGPSARRRL